MYQARDEGEAMTELNVKKLHAIIKDAMDELEQFPSGGIGGESYTLAELDEYSERTGESIEKDSAFHCVQRSWRLLESAL